MGILNRRIDSAFQCRVKAISKFALPWEFVDEYVCVCVARLQILGVKLLLGNAWENGLAPPDREKGVEEQVRVIEMYVRASPTEGV